MSDFNKREAYLIETFKIQPETVKTITELGRLIGTNKYDIWIAKEYKKDPTILSNLRDIQFVIDWVKSERPNIMKLSFQEAFEESEKWHSTLVFDENAKNNTDLEDEKILYRCNDGKHFFLLLTPDDLDNEGNIMRNCVGSYKGKITNGQSMIVSLRDDKNISHVTIEIDSRTGMTIQVRGKANTEPQPKYQKLITEFAIFASGYDAVMDKELLELMNMKFD
jgi:hypothetical protein